MCRFHKSLLICVSGLLALSACTQKSAEAPEPDYRGDRICHYGFAEPATAE